MKVINIISDLSNVSLENDTLYQLGVLDSPIVIKDISTPIDLNIPNLVTIVFTSANVETPLVIETSKINVIDQNLIIKPGRSYEISLMYDTVNEYWDPVIIGGEIVNSIFESVEATGSIYPYADNTTNFRCVPRIEGNTLVNMVRLDLPDEDLFDRIDKMVLDNGIITFTASNSYIATSYIYGIENYKPDTIYTIVIDIIYNTIENGHVNFNTTNSVIMNKVIQIQTGEIGRQVHIVRSNSNISDKTRIVHLYGEGITGSIKYKFMIFEGEIPEDQIPYNVDRMESVSPYKLYRFDLPVEDLFYSSFNATMSDDGIITTNTGNGSTECRVYYTYNIDKYKPNTEYTVVVYVLENTLNKEYYTFGASHEGSVFNTTGGAIPAGETGKFVFKVQTKLDLTVGTANDYITKNYTIASYTGYIKYRFEIFEGDTERPEFSINSINKNIWDGEYELGAISSDDGALYESTSAYRSTNYIPVDPNRNITCYALLNVFMYRQDGSYIGKTASTASPHVLDPDTYYIKFFRSTVLTTKQITYEGSSDDYQVYNTDNIIIPEVELCRINDEIYDYIENGILYKRTSGKIYIDPEWDWRLNNTFIISSTTIGAYVFTSTLENSPTKKNGNRNVISDSFTTCDDIVAEHEFPSRLWGEDYSTAFYVTLSIPAGTEKTITVFRQKLEEANAYIIYELAEPEEIRLDMSKYWVNSYDEQTNLYTNNSNVLPILKTNIPTAIDKGLEQLISASLDSIDKKSVVLWDGDVISGSTVQIASLNKSIDEFDNITFTFGADNIFTEFTLNIKGILEGRTNRYYTDEGVITVVQTVNSVLRLSFPLSMPIVEILGNY